MRDMNIVRDWGLPWTQTGATHYHAQLGLSDRGWVVCYVVWLGSMNGMGLVQGACVCIPCCGQGGYRAQVPQHPIDTQHNNYGATRHETK